MNPLSLSIIGFGNVGRGVAEVLYTKMPHFKKKYGINIKVVSITDTSAAIWNREGINLREAIETKNRFGSLKLWGNEYEVYKLDPMEVVKEINADVIIDVTNDKNASKWHLEALKRGKGVVTSNKPPVVFDYKELVDSANSKNLPYLFEATVMAGTPIIRLLKEGFLADSVKRISGVLNGTTTFILTSIETGMTFKEALKQVQTAGIAEKDPSNDLKGIDAAYKATILHHLAFYPIDFKEIHIKGIEDLSEEEIREAKKEGTPFRLVATVEEGNVEIKPKKVYENGPLAVSGTSNVAVIETDLLGELMLKGSGAGIKETASGVVGDIIRAAVSICKYL
ncbi:homoserine dehydrogenase [Thermococcus sp.]|uniref:homoserine dehydrogenase n=1 Tax=Thermococcus sp. TaxID=35749 RepID=UPI00260D63EF|nr:homoserine dehydrogenase [Thermococcus sp.]MCD6144650.1 homoserine dehydrogenase [Thermococcus sp.]